MVSSSVLAASYKSIAKDEIKRAQKTKVKLEKKNTIVIYKAHGIWGAGAQDEVQNV